MKPFQTSCGKGKEYHFESHVKEKRSYRVIKNSKPRVKEGQSINSSEIPNLARKRKGIPFQSTRTGEKEGHNIIRNSRPCAKEERNIKVLKLFRISGIREFELQSPSENSKPCTKQGQNIRYHRYEKFRMR